MAWRWVGIFSRRRGSDTKGNSNDSTGVEALAPEGATRLPDLTIGGKNPKRIEKSLDSGKFGVTETARNLLRSPEFITLPKKRTISLVVVTLKDLNLPDSTIEEIFARAKEVGLGLCPAEVGPQLRLLNHRSVWLFVGMKPIHTSNNHPYIFRLTEGNSTYNHAWLEGYSLIPQGHKLQTKDKWKFVFAL